MAQTMYKIDYDEDGSWYNNDFHNGSSEVEFAMDKLLSYLSYICYLMKTKNITEEESKILQYELMRAYDSHGVQSYLWNLHHFSKERGTICSFEHLISFGIDKSLLPKEFSEKAETRYKKRLNF
jgi:hypothetical protein